MKNLVRLTKIALVVGSLFLIFPRNAHAYLDLGTGSYLFQLIIAGLLGASYTIKVYWRNIKDYFSKRSSKDQKTKDADKDK